MNADATVNGSHARHYVDRAASSHDAIVRLREENARLRRAVDAAYSALSGSAYVGGPTEREAFRSAVAALAPVATQHKGATCPAL